MEDKVAQMVKQIIRMQYVYENLRLREAIKDALQNNSTGERAKWASSERMTSEESTAKT